MATPPKSSSAGSGAGAYGEASIRVLKGLEPVKQRPGMYTRTDNPLHIVQEVIDNAADEALGGFGKRIAVTQHTDGSVSVDDDGRGIPFGLHPEEKVPVVEIVYTRLHAGGKFDKGAGGAYSFSGGLHGVGVSVTNALAKRLQVMVWREGQVASIVFSGGMIPVTGRVGLDQASWFLPGRWGFAASASVVDLLKIAPLMSVDDQLWHHELRWWSLDIGVLLLLGAVAAFVVYRRLRLPGDGGRAGSSKVVLIVVAVVLAAGFVSGMTYLTRDSGNRSTQPTAPVPPPKAAPPGHRIDLANLLPDGNAVSLVMQSPPMATATIVTAETPRRGTAAPPPCAGVADAGSATTFAPGFTGMSGMELHNPADPNVWMVAYAVGYPGPQAAEGIPAAATWSGCANTVVTFTADGGPPRQLAVGAVTVDKGTLTAAFTEPGRSCQHVLTTKADVVIDVLACTSGGGTQAAELAKQIADKVG